MCQKKCSVLVFTFIMSCLLLPSCSRDSADNTSPDKAKNSAKTFSIVEGDFWFPLGPAPINNFFGGGVTGRASAIAVNPDNPDEVWVGGAAGGVWHTVNNGVNWVPMSDKQAALSIGALAVDQCDSSGCGVIYAGTGENAIRRDTIYGSGLLVGAVSGGEFPVFTWVRRTGDPYDFHLGSINDIVLDPTTSGGSKRIFVTLSSGTTSSASQATVTAPEPGPGGYGIYRSDNNGVNWTKLTIPGTAGARPTDLEMAPDNPDVLYAGFLGVGVFKSENGGDTWCPLNTGVSLPPGCAEATGLEPTVSGGFDHVEIAIQQNNSSALYVTFGHCADRLLQRCTPSVFRSNNGGSVWESRRTGTTSASLSCPAIYSRYTHGLAVHPTNVDRLFLGGLHLCRSDDGGQTFVASDANTAPGFSPWGAIIHLDHREVLFHPDNANRLYNTNDGGFAASTDGGFNWTPGNTDLQITGFYAIASAANTPRVLGGAQDNAGQLWTGFRAWDVVGGGDGGYTMIDYDDPLILYLGSNSGALTRSLDGGLSFNTVTPGGTSSSNRAFNAPAVQDRQAPHALYYGANRLFRSTTDASTWEEISPVLASGSTDEITPGINVITAIGVYGSRIYIGYYGGEVFTTNAACIDVACWTDVSAGLPGAPVTDIAVDPGSPNTAYLTVSGFSTGAHVWKTTNAGTLWTPAATGLPAGVPANTIVLEPDASNRIWVGLDSAHDSNRSSVYRSTNSAGSWSAHGNSLPNAPVYKLSVDESRGRIYAATHGRGAFVLSQPVVGGFEGWVNGNIWDIPVYGQSFAANQSCTVSLLQSTGDVCATGTVDAIGGNIETNADGVLQTSSGGMWAGKSVVWACLNGNCLGGTPIAECNDDENGDSILDPVSTVLVQCDAGPPGNATIPGCPDLTNPPGSLMDVGFFEEGLAPLSAAATRMNFKQNVNAPSAGAFHLAAILQSREGAEVLCSVHVDIEPGDDSKAVVTRARDAFNNNPGCNAATVTATLDGITPEEELEEDKFPRTPRLLVSAPGQKGGQIVTGILSQPGGVANGTCFSVRGLGNAMYSQLRIMRTALLTAEGGAKGGQLNFFESSGLGTCALTLDTVPGQTAGQIAQALEDLALQSDTGPKPYCPESVNPRDLHRDGDSIISAFASELQVCISDPGVGLQIAPEEIAEIVTNQPPDCSSATVSPQRLFPPNHGFRDINIQVPDPDNDAVTLTITAIAQDEAVNASGDGNFEPDGRGVGTATAQVRAERSGLGDGRVYEIAFDARDEFGAQCQGSAIVGVPHDNADVAAVDSGVRFDSTSSSP